MDRLIKADEWYCTWTMDEIESVDLAYGQIFSAMGRYKTRLKRRAAGFSFMTPSIYFRQASENLAFINPDIAEKPKSPFQCRSQDGFQRPRSQDVFQRRSQDVRNTGLFHENFSRDVRNTGLFHENFNRDVRDTGLFPERPRSRDVRNTGLFFENSRNPQSAFSSKPQPSLSFKFQHFRSAPSLRDQEFQSALQIKKPFLRDQESQPAPQIENQNASNPYEIIKPAVSYTIGYAPAPAHATA